MKSDCFVIFGVLLVDFGNENMETRSQVMPK